ncbi:TetR/AcrR family transcriptional regulator [Nitrincola sp. MINF-07-Sa-05]|uniref:TetR/AcrR family transcriptional regulator n=1 Tax=Nitrincola salilacus TaxID=3400273 RepID=UPI003917C9FB
MTNTADKILDIAEALIRNRGYQGFAFREIAAEIGIKSASVHYHFPTKVDLVTAVMCRYFQRFKAALDAIDGQCNTSDARLKSYIDMYRREMTQHKTIPLCMMLGSDLQVLPEAVINSLRAFYELNISWLSKIALSSSPNLSQEDAKRRASLQFSALNGALMGARALDTSVYFEDVVSTMLQTIK